MLWTRLLRTRLFAAPRTRRPRPASRRRHSKRLQLEWLEERACPTVTIATTNNGGQGYAGLDYTQTQGYAPPDTSGAAGPNTYVETVNQTVGLYTPKTTGASVQTDFFDHFFTTVGGLPPVPNGAFFSDPVVVYDEIIGRFIVGDQDTGGGNDGSGSAFDIAVSKTSDPASLTSADWKFYQLNTTEAGYFADYPGNMGYNHDAFVFTLNMFPNSGPFQVQIVSVSQADLANAVPSPHYFSNNIVGGYNIRPTTMHDSVAGDPMWLFTPGSDNASVGVIKMTNLLSTSAVFSTTSVPVTAYNPIVQFGSVLPLNPDGSVITANIDSRIQKAAENNNTIVAAQSVVVSPTEIDVQWYKFDVSNGVPALADQGRVSAGDNTYLVYPAIDINASGDIGMTYTRSGTDSSTDYMSMWLTGRSAADAPGSMQTPVEVPAGTGSNSDSGDTREGDLSGINLDPVDGTFWATAEYAKLNTSFFGDWGTAVANFSLSSAGEHFTLNANVSTAIAGQPIRITVAAVKDNGQIDTGYTGTVHFTSTDPLAVLPPDRTLTNGVYTFTVILETAGKQTIKVSDAASNRITGQIRLPVIAAAPYQLVFRQQPTTTPAGTVITPPVTVNVLDRFGNLVSNDNTDQVTMSIGANPGHGILSGTTPVTVANGVATFSNLSINNPGTGYTLVASDSSLPLGRVSSNSFNITSASGIIEDFERPNPLQLYTTVSPPVNAQITTAAAHDGTHGLDMKNGNGWIYRNDAGVQVSQGETISVWVKFSSAADGRAYFGFGASSTGTLSVVLAPNNNQLTIQQNPGYGFQDLGSVTQTYQPNHWYKVQVAWATGGTIQVKLYDTNGSTLLNVVTATTTMITSGGIAFRGIGHDKYFDTVTVTPGAIITAATSAGGTPAAATAFSNLAAGSGPGAAAPPGGYLRLSAIRAPGGSSTAPAPAPAAPKGQGTPDGGGGGAAPASNDPLSPDAPLPL